jgi:hypothetical protein
VSKFSSAINGVSEAASQAGTVVFDASAVLEIVAGVIEEQFKHDPRSQPRRPSLKHLFSQTAPSK